MTPERFCDWLQGFVELGGKRPTPAQWKSIVEHLQTVFEKVTPPVGKPDPKAEKALEDFVSRIRTGGEPRIC